MAAETLVPTSADEAVELFGDGDGITVFAGGTILMPEHRGGPVAAGARAAAPSQRAGRDRDRRQRRPDRRDGARRRARRSGPDELLARFAREIGDLEIRAAATVGGNLCAPPGLGSQRGDLGAPLIALGARVRSTGKGGERTEAVEDFLAGDRSGRLVLERRVRQAVRRRGRRRRCAAATPTPTRSRTSRSARTATVSASACPASARRRCAPAPSSRAGNAEDVLQDVDPLDDAVATAEYRRKMLTVLVRRALDEVGGSMTLTVNGIEHEITSPPLTALLHVLREELEIMSPKAGCQQGGCAARAPSSSTASRAARA